MDLATLRMLYKNCQDEALSPDDPRNVDFDKMPGSPRGKSWADELEGRILLSPTHQRIFFTSCPGTGKSTELRRLASKLRDSNKGNYVVVWVDATEELDLISPVSPVDLLSVLLLRADEQVLLLEGKNKSEAMNEGIPRRLWNYLSKTTTDVREGSANMSGFSLVLELRQNASLRQKVRQAVTQQISSFIKDVREEFVLINERATKRGKSGIVVILDNFEKLRGTSDNYDEVLSSAERLFSGGAPDLDLRVHSVFTVPPALLTRLTEPQVEFMPVVKVRKMDGKEDAEGISALRAMIANRISDEYLAALLGDNFEDVIRDIILDSGGYPRQVVSTLQSVLTSPQFPISDSQARRIRNEHKDRIRAVVVKNQYEWLRSVSIDKNLNVNDLEHRSTVEMAVTNRLVLRYCNEELWWDLHPAVAEIEGIRSGK